MSAWAVWVAIPEALAGSFCRVDCSDLSKSFVHFGTGFPREKDRKVLRLDEVIEAGLKALGATQ